MTTDERVTALEKRLAEYDELIRRLTTLARVLPKGRLILKAIGAEVPE